ncbi:hypothetical protein CPB85DRAFT_1433544 [Mucidula mucida]|nr:hypothetical protein CPB85DRAFT_1433544 [Mucidula mucida]
MPRPNALELRGAVASEARASCTVTADPILLPDKDQSPIQQIPVELLEAIFFQAISISPEDYSLQPQWVLRQVCRLWRNVCTSSPRLWKELCVKVHTAAKLRDAKSLLWLALLCTKEVDLVITFDTTSSASDLALTLLDLLTRRSRQWRTIHFISLDAACTRALTRVRGSLPRLRELHIDSTPDARVYEEIAAFTHAPLLEGLYLNGARMNASRCILS